jgi:hypothetical protein
VADRRADLALDVVTDDRQAGLGEAALPVRLAADEDRDRVDEADAGPRACSTYHLVASSLPTGR